MAGQWEYVGNLRGANGIGVPQGGGQGEVLAKAGNVDYATAWTRLRYDQIEGKVPASALPEITTAPFVVSDESAMLNLPAVAGRMAIRTDIGKTFILAEEPASELENWIELQTGSAVESVNGRTGNVEVTKADVGLGNVDNTADADKPLATQEVPGLLSPEDKKKLDEASSTVPPVRNVGPGGSVVLTRDPALVMYKGGLEAGGGTFEVNEPSIPANPATKKYADDLVKGRGSSSSSSPPTIDADTLADPGVYNVSLNSPGIPVIAGFRGNTRIEVERLGATIMQTARIDIFKTTSPHSNALMTGREILGSMTFHRKAIGTIGADGQRVYSWRRWVAEGSTEWFTAPQAARSSFYGVAAGPGYPGYGERKAGGDKWRISNGDVQLRLIFSSPLAPKEAGQIGVVEQALAPLPGGPGSYYCESTTNQYGGIVGASVQYDPSTRQLTLRVRGDGTGSSAAWYHVTLDWPISVEAYGGN